jgi:putative flavoprotein involved in K+ transport
VVVATGDQNLPKVLALAGSFPDRVAHYHTADYRGPGQLPDGAILVLPSPHTSP